PIARSAALEGGHREAVDPQSDLAAQEIVDEEEHADEEDEQHGEPRYQEELALIRGELERHEIHGVPHSAVPFRAFRRTLRRIGKASGRCRIRSEEHTSELQSRDKLVCRLLL